MSEGNGAEHLRLEALGDVAKITLNRPERLNALTNDMRSARMSSSTSVAGGSGWLVIAANSGKGDSATFSKDHPTLW